MGDLTIHTAGAMPRTNIMVRERYTPYRQTSHGRTKVRFKPLGFWPEFDQFHGCYLRGEISTRQLHKIAERYGHELIES